MKLNAEAWPLPSMLPVAPLNLSVSIEALAITDLAFEAQAKAELTAAGRDERETGVEGAFEGAGATGTVIGIVQEGRTTRATDVSSVLTGIGRSDGGEKQSARESGFRKDFQH